MFLRNQGNKEIVAGKQAINHGNICKALFHFDKVNKKSKYYNEAIIYKMNILTNLNRLDEAADLLLEIREEYPIYIDVIVNQMYILIKQKQYRKAMELYHQKGDKVPIEKQYTNFFWNASLAAENTHDYKSVLQILNIVEQLHVEYRFYAIRRGTVYFHLKEYDKAKPYLLEFINEYKNSPQALVHDDGYMKKALYSLMLMYNQQKEYDLAKECQKDYQAQEDYEKGIAQYKNQEYNKAIIYFNQIPKSSKIYHRALCDSIGAYSNLKQYTKVITMYHEFPKDSNLYYFVLLHYSVALMQTNQKELAYSISNQMKKGHHVEAQWYSNYYYFARGIRDIEHLYIFSKKLLQVNPNSEDNKYKYSLALYYKQRYQEAIDILLDINSWEYINDYIDVMYLLACCYRNINQNTIAEKYFKMTRNIINGSISDDESEYYYIFNAREPYNPDIL